MALKKYKPITSSRRNYVSIDYKKVITKTDPEKSLTTYIKKSAGRNNQGIVTTRHKGGGHKRLYRFIDFKRNDKDGIIGKVASIEYDPNRTSNIALINYADGEKRYILAPKNLIVGAEILSGKEAPIKVGNCLELKDIPEGTFIHNVELNPGHGAQLIRSAGTSGQVLAKEDNDRFVIVQLNSGEMRKIFANCRATIGVIGNEEHNITNDGKAGRKRWKGIRPTVRGSVMNPNDHPHGGGEGRTPIGRKAPLTPWGKKALGVKTRTKNNKSNKYIIRKRGVK